MPHPMVVWTWTIKVTGRPVVTISTQKEEYTGVVMQAHGPSKS